MKNLIWILVIASLAVFAIWESDHNADKAARDAVCTARGLENC